MWAVMMCGAAAFAQDEPRIGLTMGSPSSVGVIWQVSDKVAVRPELAFTRVTNEFPSADLVGGGTTTASADSWQVGAGVSGLFYVSRWNGVRTYLSPRLVYTKSSSSSSSSSVSSIKGESSMYTTSGSFGAQYAVARHFGVFGEVGLAYGSTTSISTSTVTLPGIGAFLGASAPLSTLVTRTESRTTSFGIRSGVGVILFF